MRIVTEREERILAAVDALSFYLGNVSESWWAHLRFTQPALGRILAELLAFTRHR